MTMERVHCREEGMTTEKGHQRRGDDNGEGTLQGKGMTMERGHQGRGDDIGEGTTEERV